jgi:H+-transporting ATPase
MKTKTEEPASKDDLKTLPMPELQAKLGWSPDGLSQAEARKRLAQYGPNEIEEKKTNPFLKFLTYFWGPIPWMIEVAVILSGVVRHWPDFFIILLLLLSNAIVGFWEERQAGNAIAALKAKLAVKAKVKRDGKWTDPAAREVVPGDVIRLRLGDIVPADARLLAGGPVEVDQSALTGESLPAERKPGEAVFSGSIMRRGEIEALVYATGTRTYLGKTAQLVQEAHTVSHFQRAVLKIGDYLIVLAVALVAVIIAVALFRHDPILATLQFALVLTVAAIPVAMPTVLSVTMAVGARLLAKKEAIRVMPRSGSAAHGGSGAPRLQARERHAGPARQPDAGRGDGSGTGPAARRVPARPAEVDAGGRYSWHARIYGAGAGAG